MKRHFSDNLVWGDFLEILSFLTLREVYYSCACTNRNGFVIFSREKTLRQCAAESLSKARFLTAGLGQQKVLLVSYPRSGNSFLRTLIEDRFGIVTGSDSRTNRTLSASLLRCGFKGEGIVDESVWIVKSHYPERLGYLKFRAARVILLVRNPFDSFESYFHMGMTNTHNKNLTKEALEGLNDIWPHFIKNETKVWCDFHHFWMIASTAGIPVLPVRYEDLLADREGTMARVEEFVKDGSPPLGLQRFMKEVIAIDKQGPGYAPKKGGPGKGLRLLNSELVNYITETASIFMDLFGYSVISASAPPVSASPPLSSSSSSSVNGVLPSIEGIAAGTVVTYQLYVREEAVIKSAKEFALVSATLCARATALTTHYMPPPPAAIISGKCVEENSGSSSSSEEELTIVPSTDAVPPATVTAPIFILPHPLTYRKPADTTEELNRMLSVIKSSLESYDGVDHFVVNGAYTIRDHDDDFGRKMTDLRKSYTADDTQPFPILN